MTEQMKSKIEARCEDACHPAIIKATIHWYLDNLWHDASEKPKKQKLCLVLSNIDAIGGNKHLALYVENKTTKMSGFLFGGFIGMDKVVKWAYLDDLLPDTLQDDK